MASAVASSGPAPPPALPSTLPSPSARRTSSGFFHTVKRAVLGPSSASTSDEDFIATRADFVQLHSQLSSLRQHVLNYRTAAAAVFGSSLLVANDFADIIRDLPRPHPYSHQLLTLAHAHNDLQEKTAAGGDGAGYGSAVLAALSRQWQTHKTLLARIEERQRLRTDFLYYHKKVQDLLAERAKRSRPEKPAETEKVERNQAKLTDSADRFRVFDQELMHDLHSLYASRLSVYGPAMLEFIAAERAFVADYDRAMRQVGAKDGTELGLGKSLSVNVNAAAAFANGVMAEHSPLQDADVDTRLSINPFGSLDPSPIGGLTPTAVGVAPDSAHSDAAAAVRQPAADASYPYEQRGSSGSRSAAASTARNPFGDVDPFADLMAAAAAGGGGGGVAAGGAAGGKGEAEAEGRAYAPVVQRKVSGYHDPFASNGAANPFFDVGAQDGTASSEPVVSAFVSSSSSSSAAQSTARTPAAAAGPPAAASPAVPQYQPVLFLPIEASSTPVTAGAPSSAEAAAAAEPGEVEVPGEEETEEEEEEAEGVPSEPQHESAAASAPVVPAAAAAAAPAPAPPAAAVLPPSAVAPRPLPPSTRPSMPPPARPPQPSAAPVAAHPSALPQPPPVQSPSSRSGAAEPNPFDDD